MASFRPTERIRRRPEFQRVHEQGTRRTGRYMTALFLPNGLTYDRLGVAASRRLGGAVQRNRAKRLIREVFRQNKPRTGGHDIVIIPKPVLLTADYQSLEADFRSVCQRYAKRDRG